MRAVIPVAGVGTRLRPHTYALPKVLLNVAGKPILAHILDSLVQSGILKATIITGYMGELVQKFVNKYYPMLEVDFVEQSKRYGLGHAIWTGKETYKDNEPLIIILGDTVFDVNLDKIFQVNKNAIGVKEVEDPRRFGVVVINKQNKIEKFIEKPLNPVSNLAIVGMYYIQSSQELINSLEYIINNNIQTKGEFQLTDALQHMLESNISFTTFNVEGWYDCGKAETLISTNKFLLDKHFSEIQVNNGNNVIIPPCFISKDAIVENSIIGPYTSVADGAVIKDSIIKNSIISYEAKVNKALLNESIIGNEVEISGTYNKFNVGNSSVIELD